ncbi:MAG: Gfo/Idh/MocA family oxidoreductase [bacterium]|nr:Gfo/Idh/MocA family oxidoreductase [bacterium]MCM1373544.1 Gfo/Idh/MocA family oxidoreductase [Muribaculum sp.]
MKKRVAIVGCGQISQVHAQVLDAMEEVELCAFVDSRPEHAQKLAERYGRDRAGVYMRLEDMLKAEHPQVVHICTPHYLHVPMAVEVLDGGGSVFMEKPQAISERQLACLEQAAEESAGTLGICFQNRYNASTHKVDELLREGSLGKIQGARAFVTWNRDAAYYQNSEWRGSWTTEGGGALINQSIHTLDLLLRWLGEPDYVEASMKNHHLKGIIEVEDTVEAFLGFPDGERVCFYATTAYVSDAPVLIELACENGSVRLEGERVTVKYLRGEETVYLLKSGDVAGKAYWGSGHAACIKDFYRSLDGKAEFGSSLAATASTLRVMMKMYQSAGVCRQEEEKQV